MSAPFPIEILLTANKKYDSSRQIEYNGATLTTCFEDIEAVSLCAGVTNNAKPRYIWRKFFHGTATPEEIFYAHRIALKLKEKYGDDFLNFCMALPPLPFKYGDVSQVFSELDKATDKLDNPIIRFLSTDAERFITLQTVNDNDNINIEAYKDLGHDNFRRTDEKHKFSLTFYTEKQYGSVILRDTDSIILKDVSKGKKIARIYRDGTFLPFDDALLTKPVISLFLKFAQNPSMMTINYGFETGECSYCGRELTDQTSLKVGYGFKCARNYGLPYR